MSAIEYYDHTTFPSQGTVGSSAAMRAELENIEAGFGKLPDLSGNGNKVVLINPGATGMTVAAATGTGDFVRGISPTLITPTIGQANFTSAGAYAVTFTFTGITGVTFPTTGTLATLAGAEILTNKTLTSPVINSPTGITAANISNTPAGNIAATTVQAAINELDAEKAALAGSVTQAFNAATVNGTPLLHHSAIINGNFPIAQAGTSFAAPAALAPDLDGWANLNTSTAVFTVAQVAGSTAGRLARQVTITTADATVAAGDYVCDSAAIEGYDIEKYVGNTFTVGFRAKVPVAGVHCVALRNSENDRSYVKEINFPTAGVYQDCSFTVTGGLPTAGTWAYTNGTGLKVTFAHMCGTTFQTTPDAWNTGNFLGTVNQVNDCATVGNVWALEKVTMNLGTVAAVSEISYEDELIRCQSYYAIAYVGLRGTSGPSNFLGTTIKLPVNMRANPTLVLSGSPTFVNVTSETLGSLLTTNPSSFSYQLNATAINTDTYVVDRLVTASARLSHV